MQRLNQLKTKKLNYQSGSFSPEKKKGTFNKDIINNPIEAISINMRSEKPLSIK